MSSYRLLVRLLDDQCIVEEKTDGKAVTVKPNKQVASDSLQNPSDPDAGYSGHKGKGYQMQVMESCEATEEKGQLSLITYIKVEPSHENDAHALLPALADAQRRNLAPATLLADTAYGSDDNVEAAKAHGVEVIAPATRNGREKAIILADFDSSKDGDILRCPAGHPPAQSWRTKEGRWRVSFLRTTCDCCPKQKDCPVIKGKRHCHICYDDRSLRLARRRRYEETEDFRDKYRFRSGVEGTMSDLDRVTGIKHLRYRGMSAIKVAATLKATGLNILRATAYRNQ